LIIHKKETIGKKEFLLGNRVRKLWKYKTLRLDLKGMSLNVYKPDPNLRRLGRIAYNYW